MRIRRTAFLILGAVALTLSACVTSTPDDAPATVTSAAGDTETKSPPARPTRTTDSPTSYPVATPTLASVVEPQPAQQRSPAASPTTMPTFVECLYGDDAWTNLALMSDGSWQWTAACQDMRDEQLGATTHQCPQSNQHVADPTQCETGPVPTSEEPSEIPVSGTPAYPLPDKAEEIAWQKWWSACMAQNTTESCRAIEPSPE